MYIGGSSFEGVFDHRMDILDYGSVFLTYILWLNTIPNFDISALHPLEEIVQFRFFAITIGLLDHSENIATVRKFRIYALTNEMRQIIQSIMVKGVSKDHFDLHPILANWNYLILSGPFGFHKLQCLIGQIHLLQIYSLHIQLIGQVIDDFLLWHTCPLHQRVH